MTISDGLSIDIHSWIWGILGRTRDYLVGSMLHYHSRNEWNPIASIVKFAYDHISGSVLSLHLSIISEKLYQIYCNPLSPCQKSTTPKPISEASSIPSRITTAYPRTSTVHRSMTSCFSKTKSYSTKPSTDSYPRDTRIVFLHYNSHMIITISTSSKKIFNILENHIERLSVYMESWKCTKYKSENDFIESLFDIAVYTIGSYTTIDTHPDWYHTPDTERHVKLHSWYSATYTKNFTLDSSIFTYP